MLELRRRTGRNLTVNIVQLKKLKAPAAGATCHMCASC